MHQKKIKKCVLVILCFENRSLMVEVNKPQTITALLEAIQISLSLKKSRSLPLCLACFFVTFPCSFVAYERVPLWLCISLYICMGFQQYENIPPTNQKRDNNKENGVYTLLKGYTYTHTRGDCGVCLNPKKTFEPFGGLLGRYRLVSLSCYAVPPHSSIIE